jgi:hypothetical protein
MSRIYCTLEISETDTPCVYSVSSSIPGLHFIGPLKSIFDFVPQAIEQLRKDNGDERDRRCDVKISTGPRAGKHCNYEPKFLAPDGSKVCKFHKIVVPGCLPLTVLPQQESR